MTAGSIETERLWLRPLRHSDASLIAMLLQDDHEAVQMTERIPDPCTESAALDWIRQHRRAEECVFAIERLGTGIFIGCIGLIVTGPEAGIGYWIGRPFWNCGYATEAGRAVLEHARCLGVRTVTAEIFPENAASARVLTKLEFVSGGQLEKELPQRGGRRRLLRFQRPL